MGEDTHGSVNALEEANQSVIIAARSEKAARESSSSAERPLLQKTLSLGRVEGKEETIQSLKNKFGNMGKDNNEPKENVSTICADLLQKDTRVRVLADNVTGLEHISGKMEGKKIIPDSPHRI